MSKERQVSMTLGEMTAEIRANNIEKGWRVPEGGPGNNTLGDYIALLHSEISEALEAYRDWMLEDATGRNAAKPDKPEGVGSEFADILIRLVDMCDIFGIELFDMDMELADVAPFDAPRYAETFGDWMTELHRLTAQLGNRSGTQLLRTLVAAAEHFGIDLAHEYERKIAYNRTRSFQHGGRALRPLPAVVSNAEVRILASADAARLKLHACIPADAMDLWDPEESEAFISEWERLGLPELKMMDAEAGRLQLWCADLKAAAEALGMEIKKDPELHDEIEFVGAGYHDELIDNRYKAWIYQYKQRSNTDQ